VRRTALLRWLLKRLKPREFDTNKEAAGSLLALLLQTHPPNAQSLADINGIDALLQVFSLMPCLPLPIPFHYHNQSTEPGGHQLHHNPAAGDLGWLCMTSRVCSSSVESVSQHEQQLLLHYAFAQACTVQYVWLYTLYLV